MQTIDLSKPSLIYCHQGYRATTAASILLRESSSNIGILIDGVEGWSALGLPLEVPTTKWSDQFSSSPGPPTVAPNLQSEDSTRFLSKMRLR
jgi:hypothetical protein